MEKGEMKLAMLDETKLRAHVKEIIEGKENCNKKRWSLTRHLSVRVDNTNILSQKSEAVEGEDPPRLQTLHIVQSCLCRRQHKVWVDRVAAWNPVLRVSAIYLFSTRIYSVCNPKVVI